jgi:hypothetical protein
MPLCPTRFAAQFARGPDPVSENQVYRQAGWYVWCSSIVRDDNGLYHLFYSRWPEKEGFEAWVTHSEIARATCTSLEGPFTYAGIVFSRTEDDSSWDAGCFHNVTVKRFGEKYYLYYVGNHGNGDWWEHRNHQRIGVAVADRPEGPWKRFDQPVLDVSPGAWDCLMVSNPTVTDTPDGHYLMIYKGVGEGPMPFGGRVLHGVAWADSPEGPFKKHPTPLFDDGKQAFGFEDPYIWREDDRYFCIIKDMSGLASPTGKSSLLLMQSSDGLKWEKSDPLLILEKSLRWQDESTQLYDRIERPSVFWDEATREMSLVVAVKPLSHQDLSFSLRLPYSAV